MSVRRAIKAAVALYEGFRERRPRRISKVDFIVPKAVAVIGYVEGIDYRTTHGSKLELYHHDFEPGSRPLLAVSSDGKQLLLLGGRYQFTEQGIVDKDARGRLITNPKHGKSINPRTATTVYDHPNGGTVEVQGGHETGELLFTVRRMSPERIQLVRAQPARTLAKVDEIVADLLKGT